MGYDTELGDTLLALARGAIGARLGVAADAVASHAALAAHGATFVTLRRDGDLRGCIGTLQAHRPLGVDVRANAEAAAFRDPRFAPLAVHEFAAIAIEVSVLGRTEPLGAMPERDALARLRPGVDGVILERGSRRATFLPQVWEQLPDPREFLAALKHKAGLPVDFWDEEVTLARYSVVKYAEVQARAAGVTT
ncbi:MAG: AmmeMemoRadiSam system protein A [Burkholderiales bacterium]|nr:AmmeMemoRadiSam system protein A [Burkholderiales bacterium]